MLYRRGKLILDSDAHRQEAHFVIWSLLRYNGLTLCPASSNGAFFPADSDPRLREIVFASIIPVSNLFQSVSNERRAVSEL
jgi:hypothetical protein